MVSLFYLLIIVLSGIQAAMEWRFYRCFSQKQTGPKQCAVFLVCMAAIYAIDYRLQCPLLSAPMHMALLWIVGRLLLRCGGSLSLLVSVLTVTVEQLSFGLINAVFGLLAGYSPPWVAGAVFPGLSAVLSLLLTWAGLRVTVRLLAAAPPFPYRSVTFLFLPLMLLFFASYYIFYAVSGAQRPPFDDGNRWLMILFFSLAYGSFYCILFACHRLAENFSVRTRMALLERELSAQREYLRAARARETLTRAFRHDIKNHLLVLDGLLKNQKTEQARAYLEKLDVSADSLSFPCRTGNDMLDILLGNKLSEAAQNGIRVDCAVAVPPGFPVDDLDLCVVFANAVDNALKACAVTEGERFIVIATRRQGNFWLAEFENRRPDDGAFEKGSGIGLESIRAVAEKYRGAVRVNLEAGLFRLNVLFNISRPGESISRQGD